MSKIGILGGMGPQASAKLYELLIEDTKQYTKAALDDDYPEIVLFNVPVPNFISNEKDLQKAKQILIDRTMLLEKSGCSVNGIACNTAHILLPELQAATKVPFLSIPELVASKVKANGFRRIGLLATPTTLQSTLYDDALDETATILRPNKRFAEQIERYIYRQMNGSLSPQDRKNFKDQIAKFVSKQELDAVILGCTELPLVYGVNDDPKIIDTLQILADALLREYFNSDIMEEI